VAGASFATEAPDEPRWEDELTVGGMSGIVCGFFVSYFIFFIEIALFRLISTKVDCSLL